MLTGLPEDPVMLLSVVNAKLRDFYPSLEELCEDLQISDRELKDRLEKINYTYDPQRNQFV